MSEITTNGQEKVTLSRTLNLFTITMIGVGGMIGAGIFVLTGIAAGVAGPGLILAFLLNGIVTTFTALSYAELGSGFPEAGGGYLWVKEGLGGTNGYLAGWMSWFAHAAAGSLYALGFGRFATELWTMAGMPLFGLSVHQMTLVWMTFIILAFTAINYRGASETGTIGNIITMTKIVILGFFVVFGVMAMLRSDAWVTRFTTGFLPNGFLAVFVAMGLTFIAFEGYEIIAQSGEEAIDPKRNVPRAIFLSIGIAVVIYILVATTAIGATTAPEGMKVFQYLGQQKEVAIVDVAKQTFPWGIGGVVLLISGLVSTMSALNATTYSSSRVSFAMGRDHNLPDFFSIIHPQRHTPHYAVLASGGLILLIAWLLPIEDVAAAADIMFLLLFLQVNVTVMALRHKMPELERGFRIPWMPVMPLIAILTNALLALNLFTFSPIAWYFAIGWLVIGTIAYLAYFSKIEEMEKPNEILQEEVLVSRDYSVVVPVATQQQARILGQIGAILARDHNGEVLALHVIKVPPQLSLGEGRLMLKEGRPLLETVIKQAKARNVPVHTVLRLGRNVAKAINDTVTENASDLMVLGWPGYTNTEGRVLGSVIDQIIGNPPNDVAFVRYREQRPIHNILVPVGGGVNSRRAIRLAISMARQAEESPAIVRLLHIMPPRLGAAGDARAEQNLRELTEGVDYPHLEKLIVKSENVTETVLEIAGGTDEYPASDMIVIGATNEPLFKRLLLGNIPEKIARDAQVTTVVVKRRNSPLHSFLRQTVLEPTNGITNSKSNEA